MVDPVLIKTFILMNLLVEKNNRGFTLIEIVVVIMIIGGILAIAVPRMHINQKQPKSVIREFTTLFKEVRNRAKLYGVSYRIAIRLDNDNQGYWVEKSNAVTYIDKEALEKIREQAKDPSRKKENEELNEKSAYQPDPTFSKKERKLDSKYIFKSVESGSQGIVQTEGIAYIHFFPQGFIEQILIQIEDPKKNIWSVTFNSITGQSFIIEDAKTLKDLYP